jgi:hypothetical protein
VEPIKLVSAWRNNRTRDNSVFERHNRFLVLEVVMVDEERIISWVET